MAIDDDVLDKARGLASKRRVPLRTVINETLRAGLSLLEAPAQQINTEPIPGLWVFDPSGGQTNDQKRDKDLFFLVSFTDSGHHFIPSGQCLERQAFCKTKRWRIQLYPILPLLFIPPPWLRPVRATIFSLARENISATDNSVCKH